MIDALPVWSTIPAAALLLCASLEAGYRLGRWRHLRTPDEKEQPVGAMVASILGLLAFVLGFTFSLAASRFESRRQVVLEEANAIGTTYLRASFLPEPRRHEVELLLRDYVDARIVNAETRELAEAIARSERLQQELWVQATEASLTAPQSISVGLFVQSLNDLIDLHAKRLLIGVRSRIPDVIWVGLLGLTVLGVSSVGYMAGLSFTRRSPAMLGLVLAFSFVLALIADLDRSQEGLLRVSQQALVDVQKAMRPVSP